MELTREQACDIGENLEMGMECYVHKTTKAIEMLPDERNIYYEPEEWQEIIDKVKKEEENYTKFSPMNSNDAFKVMEDFACSLPEGRVRYDLLDILSDRKPFANFNSYVQSGPLRNKWFAFKRGAYIDYVLAEAKRL
ncbi:UPF0158 family protein [Roseivirga sp. BDSF3-8]|uniref:UPF0158 family protein n=1 Tax=Roseivirga sp. BDSF3-8 TaxID=3241598 RepID=UPI003531C004